MKTVRKSWYLLKQVNGAVLIIDPYGGTIVFTQRVNIVYGLLLSQTIDVEEVMIVRALKC